MSTGVIVFEERVSIPVDVCNLENFRRWVHSRDFPECGRISYLAGEVDVDMSAEDLATHNQVKTEITRALGNLVLAEKLGNVFCDGALLVNEAADLSTTPDAMFCSVPSFRAGRVRYVEREEGSQRYLEVAGSPDVVIEVVSRTSVRKDTNRLPRLYFAAGIPEYWIIDARGGAIDFRILRAGRKKYVETEPDASGYRRSGVLERSFLLTREPSPAGGYWYTLLSEEKAEERGSGTV